jgi:uncharacterized protein YaiL (DUF2058 family)
MSLSLRDQLFQAGLITKKQVAAPGPKHQRTDKKPSKPAPPVDERKLAAEKAAAEKRARDAELNRIQREKAERKAALAQIRQLVEQNRLPKIDTEDYYHFTDGTHVRRLCVNAALRRRLVNGELLIVRHEGRYEMVPAAIAERVRERNPHAVLAVPASTAAASEDDPYKNFIVPDDLTW